MYKGKRRRVGNYGRYGGEGGETKYWDMTAKIGDTAAGEMGIISNPNGSAVGILWNGASAGNNSMCLIPGGSNQNQRIGQKVRVTSLDLDLILKFNQHDHQNVNGDTTINQTLHFLLLIDRQANGTAPNVSEVMQDPTVSTGTNPLTASQWFRRLDRTGRYTILWNKGYTFRRTDPQVLTLSGAIAPNINYPEEVVRHVRKHFKLDEIIEYQDSVNTTGPPVSYPLSKVCCNNIVLYCYADIDNTGACQMLVRANARLRFIG